MCVTLWCLFLFCWPIDRLVLLGISISLEGRTVAADERALQNNISLIFTLNLSLIRAYANGFTAALNMSIVWAMGIA